MGKSLIEHAKDELKYLEAIKRKLGEPVKPEDYSQIEITKRGDRYYYKKVDSTGKKYIPLRNKEFLKSNIQYSYDRRLKRIIDNNMKGLRKFLETYDSTEIREVYESLHPGRKAFVTSIVDSDEVFIQKWMKKKGPANPYPIESDLFTDKEEQVRTKSEKIIADWLYAHNIPYKYESGLKLPNGEWVSPDFTILCVKNRKEIYWEHLGMMDSPAYAEKNVRKIEMYERNNIIPGVNLLLTFETNQKLVDSRLFAKLLKPYLE